MASACITVEIIQTTKTRPSAICLDYHYYHKTTNKSTIHWVCKNSGCYASITTKDNIIVKVNNNKNFNNDSNRILQDHMNNHGPNLDDDDKKLLEAMHNLKITVGNEGGAVQQHYEKSQSQYLAQTGNNMTKVAEKFPQFDKVKQ